MVTITATYLEYSIGCENREIIPAQNNVPAKINNDSQRAVLYSENDFLKLNTIVRTIRAYIRAIRILNFHLSRTVRRMEW